MATKRLKKGKDKKVLVKSKESTNKVNTRTDVVQKINKIAESSNEQQIISKEEDTNLIKLLLFKIEESYFGIETEYISEILEQQYITPIPLTKDFLLGLINVRNNIISVIDLNKFFTDRFTPVNEHNRIVILHFNNIDTSFITNKIISVVSIPVSDFITNLESLNLEYQNFIKYIAKIEEKEYLIINIETILSSDKFNRVEL